MDLTLPVQKRSKHFEEEERCFTEEEAKAEAKRCKLCKDAPCEKASKLDVSITSMMQELQKGKYDAAYAEICKGNPLPNITGRIIDALSISEKACPLDKPIQIRRLQRFLSEKATPPKQEKGTKQKKHIGVVGAGPAGLSCAAELSKKGYQVSVYDALPHQGGHVTTRIPCYKLPREVCKQDIERLQQITFHNNSVVGKTIHIEELQKKHDAIFLAAGANTPQIFPFPGIEKGGVFTAHDVLMRINHFKAHEEGETPINVGKNVMVLGGSELAIDTARCLRRLGAQVSVVFEHGYEQMQAHEESLKKAQEENVQFIFLTQVEKFLGDKNVEGVECAQMMTQTTESGDVVTTPIEDSTFTLPCDQVYLATAQYPTMFSDPTVKIRKSRTGKPIVNQHLQTTVEGIFAGGEMRLGKVPLEHTIADGILGAQKIDQWLNDTLEDVDDDDELF